MQTKIADIAKLAIIAGNNQLPLNIIKKCLDNKIKYVAMPILDNANIKDYHNLYHYPISIGKVSHALSIMKQEQVSHFILAGGINKKVSFNQISLDASGIKLFSCLARDRFFGDNKILQIIIDFIENYGFKAISISDIIDEVITPKGIIGQIKPTKSGQKDIMIASEIAKKLGEVDVGQAVIVEDGHVLALEASEGTDEMIKRVEKLKINQMQNSGVLVKMIKPNQDHRADLPTIGPQTIKLLEKAKISGVAISADKSIIIDRQYTIDLANKLNIFVVGI